MDNIGIFIYLGFMILYGVMKALKKKKQQRPPVTNQPQPKAGSPDKGIDLEEILGELFGEGQKKQPRPPQQQEKQEDSRSLERTRTREQELEDSYNRRSKPRRLFEEKVEEAKEAIDEPVSRLKEEGKSSRYKTLNELSKSSTKKLDDMVSLDERTRSNLEVVDLDEEETGSHSDLIQALHDKNEFKKAFILSEIIQRKYEI